MTFLHTTANVSDGRPNRFLAASDIAAGKSMSEIMGCSDIRRGGIGGGVTPLIRDVMVFLRWLLSEK